MNIVFKVFFGSLLVVLISCKDDKKNEVTPKEEVRENVVNTSEVNKGEELINKSLVAHGGELFNTASYSFVFREKEYVFNNNNGYSYRMKATDKTGKLIEDELKNGVFARKVGGEAVNLTEKETAIHSQALNSVIYFATLPYKLKDKSVFKNFIGEANIKGQNYNVVEVTFSEKDGGVDFDDEFYYWINQDDATIDYLAYQYATNEGGVRFRSSYNRRTVGGIIFQDYINWKAPMGTPLKELPVMYEEAKLKELSRIETENVKNLEV